MAVFRLLDGRKLRKKYSVRHASRYNLREEGAREEIAIRFTDCSLTSIGCFFVNYAIISYLPSSFLIYFYEICYFNVFNTIYYLHIIVHTWIQCIINKIVIKNWSKIMFIFLFNLKNGSRLESYFFSSCIV